MARRELVILGAEYWDQVDNPVRRRDMVALCRGSGALFGGSWSCAGQLVLRQPRRMDFIACCLRVGAAEQVDGKMLRTAIAGVTAQGVVSGQSGLLPAIVNGCRVTFRRGQFKGVRVICSLELPRLITAGLTNLPPRRKQSKSPPL